MKENENQFFSADDLADLFSQLDAIEEAPEAEEDEEFKASQRRYDEIIKKRKMENN